MTPEQHSVFADHLHEVETPEDAEELALWLKYPGAVRILFAEQGEVMEEGHSYFCWTCDARWEPEGEAAHDADCWYVEALRLLKQDLRFVVDSAHALALFEAPDRHIEAWHRQQQSLAQTVDGE